MHNIKHLAIIMDGNRRWARQKNLSTQKGHEAGAKTLINLCKVLKRYEIPFVTVYAFSAENNSRSKDETDYLFSMLERYLDSDVKKLQKENIAVSCIGDFTIFPKKIQEKIKKIDEHTPKKFIFTLNIALNYSGRQEIIDSINKIKQIDGKITPEAVSENLYHSTPDVDLLIRTGGKRRLSNFLIWQMIYAELYFCQTLWPDFTENDLKNAVDFYNEQERNFGI